MDVMYERCCGLDVHKKSVTACVRYTEDGVRHETIQSFGTMTADLLVLRDWLTSYGVTHVAMESTGVFWKPVYYLLEDDFALLLVNPAHIKNVPGRKTDVKDSAWIAQLLEHGLLTPSFVPPKPIRELRDITRYRKSLIQDRARQANRLHKVLEDAGIQLSSVATDVLGKSGRAMLEALVSGTTDPQILSELAKGKLRAKIPELQRALKGRFRGNHAFLLSQILGMIDSMDETIAACSTEVEQLMRPFSEKAARLCTIPGISQRTAEVIIAEIGDDMTRFPSARHLASWAGISPGNNESAGKRKSGKTTKGSNWLRIALIEAARGASRSKGCYLSSLYFRVRKRRGDMKAIVAVAHAILTICYHLLSGNAVYQDLGADYFEHRTAAKQVASYVSRLQNLGFNVTLVPAETAAAAR